MSNWLDNLTGTAGTVLDTMQDVLDVVRQVDDQPVITPTTVPVATPAPAPAPAPAGFSSDSMIIVLVVVVLAVVFLR